MGFEDTVLGTTQDAIWDFEKFKLDQAEASFKAGREYEHKIMISYAVDEGNKAFKDGRRNVVEFIKENRETPMGTDAYGYYIWESKLEAKLKDWGIDPNGTEKPQKHL